MIDSDLTNERYQEWEKAIVDQVTITVKNLKGLDQDFKIAG